MKINMQQVNLNNQPDKNGRWWHWKEICDNCGKVIFDEQYIHSFPGDESEEDLCVQCLIDKL